MPAPAKPSAFRTWFPVFLLFLLLVLLALFLYWQYRQRSAPPSPPTATAPAGIERDMLYGGQPRSLSGEKLTLLTNIAYLVGYSEEHKNPAWVAYRLFRLEREPVYPREGIRFHMDLRTRARVTSDEYNNSGFDRGHMAPNHAIAGHYGPQAQIETFLMSNICPQRHSLNAGPWEELEKREDDRYANRYGQAWIIDGPLYDDPPSRLRAGIAIPRAFFKIIVTEDPDDSPPASSNGAPATARAGRPRMRAYIMPQNAPANASPDRYLTTVRQIEDQAHLDFFWQLGAPLEDQLETAAPQPAGADK